MNKHPAIAAAVISALVAAPAIAATGTLPAPSKQGDVVFLTGGASEGEARAFEREADHYPLTLELVRKDQPAGNVKISIRDAGSNRTVLDTTTSGRYLLAKLPAGRYAVTAERGNDVKTQQVTLTGKYPDRMLFSWK